MRNVIQFGCLFKAAGCTLNFLSDTNQLQVVDFPDAKEKFVMDALNEIDQFEDTATFGDGLVAIPLADLIDGNPTSLSEILRLQILETSGIMHHGFWVNQIIQHVKTTRSWHSSDEPNVCTKFGEICTKRGIERNPHKRGRPSNRSPDEFHMMKASGISRENLVTPGLEALTVSIDRVLLVSRPPIYSNWKLDRLDETELQAIMDRIQKELKVREDNQAQT